MNGKQVEWCILIIGKNIAIYNGSKYGWNHIFQHRDELVEDNLRHKLLGVTEYEW